MVTYSSDLFLDIFCVYTQSSDIMGLIFHAKLTACFISNIYAGFILLKKCTQVLKIKCTMECPPFSEKFVSYKNMTKDKQLSSSKKSSKGCTFLISHFSIHIRNDNVA